MRGFIKWTPANEPKKEKLFSAIFPLIGKILTKSPLNLGHGLNIGTTSDDTGIVLYLYTYNLLIIYIYISFVSNADNINFTFVKP